MIQRIQSVFLGLIILLTATLCGVPVLHLAYSEPAGSTEYTLNLFFFRKIENGLLMDSQLQFGLIFLASIVIGLSLYILLQYKNRIRQIRLTLVNMAALVAMLTIFTVKAYLFVPDFSAERLLLPSVLGIALFPVMIYLNIRVYYLIKRDEELVRNADRIR